MFCVDLRKTSINYCCLAMMGETDLGMWKENFPELFHFSWSLSNYSDIGEGCHELGGDPGTRHPPPSLVLKSRPSHPLPVAAAREMLTAATISVRETRPSECLKIIHNLLI